MVGDRRLSSGDPRLHVNERTARGDELQIELSGQNAVHSGKHPIGLLDILALGSKRPFDHRGDQRCRYAVTRNVSYQDSLTVFIQLDIVVDITANVGHRYVASGHGKAGYLRSVPWQKLVHAATSASPAPGRLRRNRKQPKRRSR